MAQELEVGAETDAHGAEAETGGVGGQDPGAARGIFLKNLTVVAIFFF